MLTTQQMVLLLVVFLLVVGTGAAGSLRTGFLVGLGCILAIVFCKYILGVHIF